MPSEINIPQYLYQWFQEFDELVIPNLGRFEADYQNALIQPGVNKILPPNKEIYFDASVKGNDPKFAFYIANKENISFEEAESHIHNFVQTLKAELGVRKEYQAGIFGKFIYTPQSHIDFHQNDETVYAGSSFGLPELYNLKPTQSQPQSLGNTSPDYGVTDENREKEIEKQDYNYESNQKQDFEEDEIIVEEEFVENSSRRWVSILVIFLLAIITGAIILIIADQNPMEWLFNKKLKETDSEIAQDNPLQKEDILDADRTAGDEEVKKEDASDNTNDEDKGAVGEIENPAIDYPTDDSFVKSFRYNATPPSNLTSYMVNSPNAQSRYYVILGSFGNQANAYSYLNNLLAKGHSSAKIIAPDSKHSTYRTAYRDYTTRKIALEQGREFAKQNKLPYFILKY